MRQYFWVFYQLCHLSLSLSLFCPLLSLVCPWLSLVCPCLSIFSPWMFLVCFIPLSSLSCSLFVFLLFKSECQQIICMFMIHPACKTVLMSVNLTVRLPACNTVIVSINLAIRLPVSKTVLLSVNLFVRLHAC